MSITKVIPCLILAALLGGCTMAPEYRRPVAPVGASFPLVEGPTEARVDELGVKEVFRDERLVHLIEAAMVNNRDLRVAALNVEQARAQYRITRSASLPSVAGNGSFLRSHASERTTETWQASLGSTAYEVDLFGRVRSLNRQALEKFLATVEGERSTRISLVSELALQYFAWRQAAGQLDLARATLDSVEESRTLNQASVDAGQLNELDLRIAEGQVHTARINIITYERRLAEAANAIDLLVGGSLPPNLPKPAEITGQDPVAEIPVGLPSELLERRPDILQAEHTLKAANANIGAARAAFFPSVKLTASAGTTSAEFEKLLGSGTGIWSFSPQLTVPIFTAGQNRADLDAAKVRTRIEAANYEKSIQRAFREVADALVAARTQAAEITERDALITALSRRFELASLRYRQGLTAYFDVLSAQQELYSARQGRIDAVIRGINARISLYQALGGGWKP